MSPIDRRHEKARKSNMLYSRFLSCLVFWPLFSAKVCYCCFYVFCSQIILYRVIVVLLIVCTYLGIYEFSSFTYLGIYELSFCFFANLWYFFHGVWSIVTNCINCPCSLFWLYFSLKSSDLVQQKLLCVFKLLSLRQYYMRCCCLVRLS